jgi:chitodextrinase
MRIAARRSKRKIICLALVAVAACSGSAAAAAAQPAIVGTMVERHGDDFARDVATPRFVLMTDGNRVVPLSISRALGERFVGKRVAVSFGAHGRVSVAISPSRRLSATKMATGSKRIAVILFNFSNDMSQPYTAAYATGVAFTNTDSVSAYYADSSWGQLSLSGDVYGWYTIPDTNTTCSVDTWANSANKAAAAAGVSLSGYTNVVYAFPLVSSCAWNGWADLPGTRSWLNGPSGMTVQGMAHELGHNFGLNHASSLVCTQNGTKVSLSADPSNCTTGEYGDPFSVMGSAKHYSQTNFARGSLGFLSTANTQTVTASGDYVVAPIEFYNPTAAQVLRIARTSSTYFTLEFRQPASIFDTFAATDSAVTGLIIRVAPSYGTARSQLVDTTPGSTMSFFDAPLALGRTLTDPLTGISITTLDVSPFGATARIAFPGATAPPPTPTDLTAPTPPGRLTATATDPSNVSLSWSASTDNVGVAGYHVYRGSALVATVATPGYTDTGLTAATAYTYQVVAYDAAGNTSSAASASVTTPAAPPSSTSDTSPPSAPTNLTATLGKGKKVVLSWGASADNVGVVGYRVYRNGVLAGNTSTASYSDTLPGKTTSATYYVVAYDAAGNASPASNSITVQP